MEAIEWALGGSSIIPVRGGGGDHGDGDSRPHGVGLGAASGGGLGCGLETKKKRRRGQSLGLSSCSLLTGEVQVPSVQLGGGLRKSVLGETPQEEFYSGGSRRSAHQTARSRCLVGSWCPRAELGGAWRCRALGRGQEWGAAGRLRLLGRWWEAVGAPPSRRRGGARKEQKQEQKQGTRCHQQLVRRASEDGGCAQPVTWRWLRGKMGTENYPLLLATPGHW